MKTEITYVTPWFDTTNSAGVYGVKTKQQIIEESIELITEFMYSSQDFAVDKVAEEIYDKVEAHIFEAIRRVINVET